MTTNIKISGTIYPPALLAEVVCATIAGATAGAATPPAKAAKVRARLAVLANKKRRIIHFPS